MQIKIHASMVSAHERAEGLRVIWHREAQNRPIGFLVENSEGPDRKGGEHGGPGENQIPTTAVQAVTERQQK